MCVCFVQFLTFSICSILVSSLVVTDWSFNKSIPYREPSNKSMIVASLTDDDDDGGDDGRWRTDKFTLSSAATCATQQKQCFHAMCFYLNVILAGLLELFEAVLCFTGVHCWRRSHAHALLTVRSLSNRLHGVRITWSGAAVLDMAAVRAFDRSDNAAAHTVRPWWHSPYFVIITQQLKWRQSSYFLCLLYFSQ